MSTAVNTPTDASIGQAVDPFDTLGVAATFDLDAADLATRHKSLSRELHPDRFVGKSAQERRLALGKAIEVNDAYRRLRDPIKRAEALLVRHGMQLNEGKEPKPSQAFLMEMLELREEVSDASTRKDVARLSRMQEKVSNDERCLLEAVGRAFRTLTPETISAVAAQIGALRYLRRVGDELTDQLEELTS